ncbi:Hpt domain-containing protein, partial [Clostridiaceae bacterium HSG29]|nr:Hpt domain-containing protein [Clostridiaceae bacterium HSG29]
NYFKNLYSEIGNDIDLLIELTGDFKTIYFDSIENLKNATLEHDYYKMDRIAHKLKGASLNFNMPIFSEATEKIEFIGKDKLKDNVTEFLLIMENEFKRFEIECDNLNK